MTNGPAAQARTTTPRGRPQPHIESLDGLRGFIDSLLSDKRVVVRLIESALSRRELGLRASHARVDRSQRCDNLTVTRPQRIDFGKDLRLLLADPFAPSPFVAQAVPIGACRHCCSRHRERDDPCQHARVASTTSA